MLRIDDLTQVFPNAAEDVRGFGVVSAEGVGVGHVSAVFLDPHQRKVRFLEVVVGPGGRAVPVPIDAITEVRDRRIQIEQTAARVLEAPGGPRVDWEEVYRHYGYVPHWEAGNIFPGYPSE